MTLHIMRCSYPKYDIYAGQILSLEGECAQTLITSDGRTIPSWATKTLLRKGHLKPYTKGHWAKCPECGHIIEMSERGKELLLEKVDRICGEEFEEQECEGILEMI